MGVKIADLGLSKTMQPGDFSKTMQGTPLLMSPQMLAKGEYDDKTDVWSLGCMFYQLLTGFTPFTARDMKGL